MVYPWLAMLIFLAPRSLYVSQSETGLLIAMLVMHALAFIETLIRKQAVHLITLTCAMDLVFTYWLLLSR